MRKKVLAAILTIALCTMMSTTAFAASSSSGSSSSGSGSSGSGSGSSGGGQSSSAGTVIGNVNTDSVVVATVGADGTVSKVNLTQYTQKVNNTVVSVAAGSGTNAGEAVSAVLTTPASDVFKATINALNGNIRLINAGGYKVVATSADGTGKTIASVGTIPGVTKYAFVILTAVNADGTVEIVEGTVDPVSLQIMGAFTGKPATITVSVIMAA